MFGYSIGGLSSTIATRIPRGWSELKMRPGFLFSAILCAIAFGSAFEPASSSPEGYAILDNAHAFRGRITYNVHRRDTLPAPQITGTLTIGNSFWSVDERSADTIATASNRGGSLQGGGLSTGVGDPLAAGAIANGWAIAMGTLSEFPATRAAAGNAVWRSAALRLYLDDSRNNVQGLADTAAASNVTIAFDDWVEVAGVRLPQRAMRLRAGVPEASYSIEGYAVLRTALLDAAPAPAHARSQPESIGSSGSVALQPPIQLERIPFPWGILSSLFGLLLLAGFIVAWTRREAITEVLRERVQHDPRGWQSRGVSLFVTADGRLWFDGAEYKVGAQFYGRQAVVQTSPLFLRIGAREVPRSVVLARKFRIPALRSGKAWRARSTGFSLVENVVAVGLFAAVIVGAVYPTLAVMANGDRIARTQDDAVRLAANALNDEEIASAYGTVSDGSVRTLQGQFTVVVTVETSQTGLDGAHDIDVLVEDSNGRSLAHAISTVGPAVPAPPPPGHTPNPSPAPSG